MAIYPLGSNRPKRPFEFGLPEPDLYEGSYDDLFEPQNDIQNIRVASVMDQPPDPLYAPETVASERFKQLLDQFPERGDPTFMDKLAGAGAYLGNVRRHIAGGQDAAEKAKYAGYNRELEDWKEQIKPAEVASTQENQRNINSRNLAALEIKERNDTRRLDETERKNKATEDIKQQNVDLQNLKYTNPDLKFDFTGTKVKYVNPRTGEVVVTKIDTDRVSDMTKLIAAQERTETMAAAANARNIASGAILNVDEKGNPVVINPRADTPTQTPVQGGTPIKKVPSGNRAPGEVAPARGDDLARVRGMTARALKLIKDDFLVMPKDAKGSPTMNPKIRVGAGWKNWDPAQFLPESPQRSAVALQKRLKDLLTLELIGDMKAQSKTGATGFGQLTGRELDVLESAASTLDWAREPGELTAELIAIMEKLEKVMQPGEGEENVAVTPKGKPTTGEMLRKYGGL